MYERSPITKVQEKGVEKTNSLLKCLFMPKLNIKKCYKNVKINGKKSFKFQHTLRHNIYYISFSSTKTKCINPPKWSPLIDIYN